MWRRSSRRETQPPLSLTQMRGTKHCTRMSYSCCSCTLQKLLRRHVSAEPRSYYIKSSAVLLLSCHEPASKYAQTLTLLLLLQLTGMDACSSPTQVNSSPRQIGQVKLAHQALHFIKTPQVLTTCVMIVDCACHPGCMSCPGCIGSFAF